MAGGSVFEAGRAFLADTPDLLLHPFCLGTYRLPTFLLLTPLFITVYHCLSLPLFLNQPLSFSSFVLRLFSLLQGRPPRAKKSSGSKSRGSSNRSRSSSRKRGSRNNSDDDRDDRDDRDDDDEESNNSDSADENVDGSVDGNSDAESSNESSSLNPSSNRPPLSRKFVQSGTSALWSADTAASSALLSSRHASIRPLITPLKRRSYTGRQQAMRGLAVLAFAIACCAFQVICVFDLQCFDVADDPAVHFVWDSLIVPVLLFLTCVVTPWCLSLVSTTDLDRLRWGAGTQFLTSVLLCVVAGIALGNASDGGKGARKALRENFRNYADAYQYDPRGYGWGEEWAEDKQVSGGERGGGEGGGVGGGIRVADDSS